VVRIYKKNKLENRKNHERKEEEERKDQRLI
jgi:hypothetical protein